MRVGIFTESYPPLVNGVSTSILNLQRALEKQGHEVFIVTVSDEKLKYTIEDDGKILRLPSFQLMNCYDYKFTSVYPIKAISMIKKMNLDVIHSKCLGITFLTKISPPVAAAAHINVPASI